MRQDDPEAALECATEALESARGEKAVQLLALCACVDAHVALGDAKGAASRAEEAVAVANGFDSHFSKASALLALVKALLMNHQESKDALAVLREIGATWGETALLLGLAQEAAKESAQAPSLLERAKQKKNRWQEAFALLVITMASLPKGAKALTAIGDFLAFAKQNGVHVGATDAASGIRRLHLYGGTMQDLEEIHDRLSVASKSGKRLAQAWATLDLADAKLCQGSQAKVPELEDAQQQLQKLGSKEGLAACTLEASRSHLACGRPVEALKEAQAAATAFKELGDVPGQAAASSSAALAHLALGQSPEAVALASKAPQDLAERGLRRACANALLVASRVYLKLGERDRTMQVALEAAAALRDVGDTRGEAFALLQEVGSAYLHKNEVDSALRVASAALRQLRTCEDLSGEVTALKATAEIHLTRGDTEPALRLLQEVVSLCRDSGDVEDQVDALIRIARLWVLRSEPEEATKAAKAALEAAQSGKKELAEAEALLGLAGVLKAKKDLAGAQTEAGKAEKLFKKCGHRPGELAALMLSWSAMVEEGPQQVAQVVQAAKKAAEAFKSAGDQQCAAEAFLEASAASREHGQVEEAASTAAAALQLFRQLGHTSGEVKALGAVSAAEGARGRVAESVKAAVDVVSLYQRRKDTRGQAEATCELAKVHLALGLLKDALSEVGEARLLFQKLGQLQIEEAAVLLEVGVPTLMALNDPPKAVAMAEDAAKLYRAFGDRKGEAAALSACAKVCVQQGDNASALQAARQAVAVLSRARLAREEAEALHLIARVYAIRREAREAVSSAAQALSLLRRPGDEAERADVLTTASCVHSMGLESEGAVAAAEEAVGLCRRLGDKRRLAAALHALAEGLLLKQDYGQAVDTAEEALQVSGLDPQLQAHLSSVSAYGRLAWSQAKKKGLRANPKQLLQKAKAASDFLLASGDRRFEAEAKFLMAKAHLKADNVETASKEAMGAYDLYATLRDGQGLGWTGLLYSSCLLRSPAKMMTSGMTSITSKEVEMPQYDGALQAALVAHSTFRRCGDEEGVEAALKAIHDIRCSMGGGASAGELPKDVPRPRPMPPAFSSAAPALVNPYHELVGGRHVPCLTGLKAPPSETFDVEVAGAKDTGKLQQEQLRPQIMAPVRSALASIENMDNRFDRKAWHNVKATMSGFWEFPDLKKPEGNMLMSAEFVNSWLEGLLAAESLTDR